MATANLRSFMVHYINRAYPHSERRDLIVLFRNSSDSADGVAAASKARRDSNGSAPETVPASGLYADIENLQNRGQRVILTLAENWPPTAPPLKSLTLYVRADMTELWRAWATSAFPNLDVIVSGVQHFTRDVSKNSADIAITANAMADWLLGSSGLFLLPAADGKRPEQLAAIRCIDDAQVRRSVHAACHAQPVFLLEPEQLGLRQLVAPLAESLPDSDGGQQERASKAVACLLLVQRATADAVAEQRVPQLVGQREALPVARPSGGDDDQRLASDGRL